MWWFVVVLAAFDVGLKRVGVALAFKGVVLPQDPIFRKNRNQAANEAALFLKNWSVDRLIVGLPTGSEDSLTMQKRVKHFISLINFDKEICYVDEYGSSLEAKELMRGKIKQKRDGKIDSLAAVVILNRYLSQN